MIGSDLIYNFAKEHVIRASGLLSLLMPQTSGVGIAVKELDGRYKLTNQVMEALLDKSADQIAGMTDSDLFAPEVAAKLQRSDRQITDGAAAASDELDFSINGMLTHCLWLKFPVLGPDGKALFIGAVVLDISGQEAIAEVRQSMERLQQTNQELQKTLVELGRLASTDKLTGAWNRRRLEETVLNEMDRLRRYDHPLSLMIIDIDLFKKINDHHGHAGGDQVLAELVVLVQAALRATDSLTRWGGEEFIVLCPNTTLSSVAMLAERLRAKIAGAVFSAEGNITASIGVAECMSEETWEQWFQRADTALYRAKANGRDQVQVAPETPQRGGVGEKVSANFVQLAWRAAYECGHPVVDDEHRALFGDVNNLLAALLSARPADEVSALIDTLIRNVVEHFQDEEAVITTAGFPGAEGHASIHRKLVDRAVALSGLFHAGTSDIGEVFQFLAYELIARHILGADREFFPYLEAQGSDPKFGKQAPPTSNASL